MAHCPLIAPREIRRLRPGPAGATHPPRPSSSCWLVGMAPIKGRFSYARKTGPGEWAGFSPRMTRVELVRSGAALPAGRSECREGRRNYGQGVPVRADGALNCVGAGAVGDGVALAGTAVLM